MLQRSKAASSLLFAARAARIVLPSSTPLVVAPCLAPVCADRDIDRIITNNHPASCFCAAICRHSEGTDQAAMCNGSTIDTAVASGNRFTSAPRNSQRWSHSSPLTAAWHAAHAAAIGAPHYHHPHDQQQHHQQQTSPTVHVSGLHTSAAASAVAERVDTARYVDEVAHAVADPDDSGSGGMESRFEDIQEVAAVYDEMRENLRQTPTADVESEFRSAMEPEFLDTDHGRLAYHSCNPTHSATQQESPGVIFCGGLLSNMNGKKATLLEVHARQRGHPFVRFDYRGHGASDGEFEDTFLGDWYEDTLAIIDRVAQPGRQHVLVGSSIGAWIALKAAASRRESIQGAVLLAPAVDITEVWWDNMSPEQRADANHSGFVPLQNSTPAGARLRVGFFEEASNHCILDVAQRDQQVRCPVRIFHGTADDVVPPCIAGEVASWLESKDVKVSLIKGGDHRLSRPEDLRSMMLAVEELLAYKTK